MLLSVCTLKSVFITQYVQRLELIFSFATVHVLIHGHDESITDRKWAIASSVNV
jgi:hypothetical protein